MQSFVFSIDPATVQQYHQQATTQRQQRSLRYITTPDGYTLPGGQTPVSSQEADQNFWQQFIGQPGQGFWGGQFGIPNTQFSWYNGGSPSVTWRTLTITPFLGLIPELQGGGWGGNAYGGNVFY